MTKVLRQYQVDWDEGQTEFFYYMAAVSSRGSVEETTLKVCVGKESLDDIRLVSEARFRDQVAGVWRRITTRIAQRLEAEEGTVLVDTRNLRRIHYHIAELAKLLRLLMADNTDDEQEETTPG